MNEKNFAKVESFELDHTKVKAGFLARIIQHENDHLDGILYIDRGDPDFAAKTTEQFKKRAERAAEKAKAKEAKAKKIAAKIAAKEAKKK